MVNLKQTLATLILVALFPFKFLCEAAGGPSHTQKPSVQCVYNQTNAVKTLVVCVYSDTDQAECKRSFKQVWRKLARPKQGNAPTCYKEYPPSQSVVSIVSACTQVPFDEQKCHRLANDFLDLAYDKDKIVCDAAKKPCSDGSYVTRDPEKNCAFRDCPIVECDSDVLECPDGSEVTRDPAKNSEFSDCCNSDVLKCPGEINVTRDPKKNCTFPDCPKVCEDDWMDCPDGTRVYRYPYYRCNFKPCCCNSDEAPACHYWWDEKCCFSGDWICPGDKCADGLTYGMFERLGGLCRKCPEDVKDCPDGVQVGLDPDHYCIFYDCPKCCDPKEEPGEYGNPICFMGHRCCPDGTWSCSIGDGETFPCGRRTMTGGFGKKCT